MRNQKVLFFILLCYAGLKSFSQISADFTQGCAPLSVHFTGDPGAAPGSMSWNFGAGGSSSPFADADNTYNLPGTYIVTYTAIIGGSASTQTLQITVFPKPTGTYSAIIPINHCAPLTVQLTASGGPPGCTYNWGFGATGATGATIPHTYNIAGVFSPTMFVTDANGCNGDGVVTATITVSAPPVIIINANPGLSACSAPFTTAFNGSGSATGSPLGGSLTYSWTFGNSTPSSSQVNPPAVTYAAAGQFVVTLTAKDNNQCSSTATTVVSVSQPTLSATIPGTVCINQLFDITASSSQQSMTWQMGDGGTEYLYLPVPGSAVTNTIHQYSTPGLKTITLSVTSGTCMAQTTKTVFVEEVTASFTSTPLSITCSPTLIAGYINQSSVNSTAPLTYTWSASIAPPQQNYNYIGSPAVTNVANPTFTFYQNSLNPYTIYQVLTPTINLLVQSTSIAGCSAKVKMWIDTLMRPVAWFNKNKREGCAPLSVEFRDTSFNVGRFPVTSYTWNNGANPPVLFSGVLTPPAPIPPHTFVYTSAGTYTPFLTIQTLSNCPDVSFIDTVIVVNQPTVNLLPLSSTTVCAGQPVQLNMTASTQTTTQHWHVETDNGFFSGCVSNASPTFSFTHIGTHSFTVSATQNGCEASAVSTQTIAVKGPIGKVRHYTNCTARKEVEFRSFLQEVQTATLSFGDNSSVTITGNPTGNFSSVLTHTYALTGNYTVTLKSSNSANACGIHTFTLLVNVRDAQALISSQPAIPPSTVTPFVCVGVDSVDFNGSFSTDEAIGCRRGYTWSFMAPGNPTLIPTLDQETPLLEKGFHIVGIYTVSLMVKDVNGCTDTETKTFRVSGATPSFTFNSNPICFSDNPVTLINTTSGSNNFDPIVNYQWTFGDNSPVETNTLLANTTHTYAANPPSTSYGPMLTATNSAGCISSIIHPLVVRKPSATFNASSQKVCIPAAVTFTCPLPVYATYTISYSDSTSSRITTAVNMFKHNYTTSGNHTVSLIVKDNAGCLNNSSMVVFARTNPVASFTTITAGKLCATPASFAQVNFTNTSTTTDTNSPLSNYRIWDVDGAQTNSVGASGLFSPGAHVVTLIVYAQGDFCYSVATKTIYVYNTQATLTLNTDKRKFCLGETVTATLSNPQDAGSWNCNMGFGAQASATPVNPLQQLSYTYTNAAQTGTTDIIATIYSPGSACIMSPDPVRIEIIKLKPDFKRNLELTVLDSMHCINVPDKFTHGNSNTTATPLTYNWNFGNGNTTTAPNPDYVFPQPGVWPVQLTISADGVGCNEISVKNMTINGLPTVSLSATDNCPDKPFVILASSSGAASGTWSPAQNILSGSTFSTSSVLSTFAATATAAISTDFHLSVSNAFGCVSQQAIQSVYIQQPANVSNKDTTIVIGEPVPIEINAGSSYTYSWTPLTNGLTCTDCYNPVANSTVNITYTVVISDKVGCGAIERTYKINILDYASVDVPTAFTPNGDGVNDIIYVDGWGIKALNYFRIYNRWGQLLFESNDLQNGWNGYFNGVPQNMETYIYQVSISSYVDEKPILKTGTIKIIR